MSDRATSTLLPPIRFDAEPIGSRTVRRRRTLPGSRAVVGGLLVAGGAVGLFAAYGSATAGPVASYVVMTHDVPAGQQLDHDDLALVAIDLPGGQRAVSFTDRDLLVGSVAVGHLRQGQLVQSSDVAKPAGGGELAQISVAVEAGNAMNGDGRYLRGDEQVDVIVTSTSGSDPVTETVATDALVVEVLAHDQGLGSSGRLTVVLGVRPEDLEPIAGAAASGTLTLARTTGLDR